MSADSEESVELASLVASLNQLLNYDYVELGESSDDITLAFEVAVGLREAAPAPSYAASLPRSSVSSGSFADYLDLPAYSRQGNDQTERRWSLSLTDDFVKETTGIDRKLQGRVLEALLDLVKAPMTPKGDSCKPLSGKLSGLWRVRLGDTRLIYKPDPERLVVYCLSFGSRGGAYRDAS